MSRHHPYSGYDDSSQTAGGHRKFGFGGREGRGNFGASSGRRGASQHGLEISNSSGGRSKGGWESNSGPDRNYSEHGSFERELPHFPRSGHKGLKSRGGARGKLRGGFSKFHADVEKELSIDERIQRERPCRTLFVRNVKYETNSQEVREKFEQMGEVKIFFDLISTRGMAFITYYDLRAATIAKEKLQGTNVTGRPIDVHYSLPKDNELQERCDREKNQGTLFLAINGANNTIDDDELKAKFEAYGEIRSIKGFKDSPYQRFVEFWDSRSCEQAYDDLVGSQYLGGKLDLKFSWDTGMVPKGRLSKERRESEDGTIPYDYEQFDNQDYDDREQSSNFGHDDNINTNGTHKGYQYNSDRYDSRASYQMSPNLYSSNYSKDLVSQPAAGGNEIDLGRLDQAQKVQELLASLTKVGTGTAPPSVATGPAALLPLAAHALNKYSTETPVSSSTTQSAYYPSATGMMSMQQLPPNFTPNYPSYPALPPTPLVGHAPQVNPTTQSFKDITQIIGQLYSPTAATPPPPSAHTSIPSINYSSTRDTTNTLVVPLAAGSNQSSAQRTITLPPSVLDLLRQNGANSAGTYPSTLSPHNPYQLIKPESSPPPAIPTAPRAMKEAANLDNLTNKYLSAQASSSLINSMARSNTSAAAAPVAQPSAAQASLLNNFSLPPSLTQATYNHPAPAGITNPSTNAAVQQLLTLLQQKPESQ